MTTAVSVTALHWPIKVTQTNPMDNGAVTNETIVAKGASQVFHVHDSNDVHFHEVQPNEMGEQAKTEPPQAEQTEAASVEDLAQQSKDSSKGVKTDKSGKAA